MSPNTRTASPAGRVAAGTGPTAVVAEVVVDRTAGVDGAAVDGVANGAPAVVLHHRDGPAVAAGTAALP
nr:hypothetical protein KitaXyl93_53250 [Kitasatospora sp. Xyl93]